MHTDIDGGGLSKDDHFQAAGGMPSQSTDKPAVVTYTGHDENACLKCGKCCRLRVREAGEVFVLPWSRCEHLDLDTKMCKVYEKRFLVRPECLTVEQGIVDRSYPRECPYVQGLRDYTPPLEMPNMEAVYAYQHWW